MDQMVLKAQQWVNATYAGVSGYNACIEDGMTGWNTIYSLTRGLQHELGITALSDNFGPTTWADLQAYGQVGVGSANTNMRTIVEAALYCKGYSGGEIDGAFGLDTCGGLTSLVGDMGLADRFSAGPVTGADPKVFKALLSMDAYVRTAGGSDMIQTCQRWLNDGYYDRGEFFIGPCDGHFSRNVQKSLVLGIQYQMGLTDSQVTGSIGPTTEGALKSAAADVSSGSQDPGPAGWVRLFQSAVAFNGYNADWGDGGGTFSSTLASTVQAFQRFCSLDTTGRADYETWMSLLVSTGDPDRKGTAFDCMYPLNPTTIQTVKDNGYATVGRYLIGGTNKVLTNSEIALIFDNGLSLFPIYQDEGNALADFGYDLGVAAAQDAAQAATAFGMPAGTVVYFSVDFDATDADIDSAIIPHFQGIAAGMPIVGTYAVGVYGCRNVCGRLESAGLATRSFVSGMSTGYSGNLGYALPDNWAFDQIKDFTLAAGTSGAVEIDNDIASGRDPGLNSVTRPRDPNDGFYTYLIWLEARAGQWIAQGNTSRPAATLVAQYLRVRNGLNKEDFSDDVFGSLDQGFVDFVNGYPDEPFASPLRDPGYLWDCDMDHFGASFGAVVTTGRVADLTSANLADFGTWGGDLVSVLGQFHQSGLSDDQAYSYATGKLFAKDDETFFSLSDFLADMDAWALGYPAQQGSQQPLSTGFEGNYASVASAGTRCKAFYQIRFGNSPDTLGNAAISAIGRGDDTMNLIRAAFWLKDFGSVTCPTPQSMSDASITGVAEAFRDAVIRNCG